MSTSYIAFLNFVGKQVNVYIGMFLLITGVIGGLLNSIVLLSLRTFRQSSCAFYLTIMSFANLGQICAGILFSRLYTNWFGIELATVSLFYCKIQSFLLQSFVLSSLSCLCLATIDQYCATCSNVRWQQFCNIKLARRIVIIVICIFILHGIPNLVFYNHVQSTSTGKVSCIYTNTVYAQYRSYVTVLLLMSFLPVIIAGSFGMMAWRNVQQLAYRIVPLVRRELDKQLTTMVLSQIIINAFTMIPYCIITALALNTSITSDPISAARFQLTLNITLIMFYAAFANPFYIYICVSERYRRQFIYVLGKICWNRWKPPQMVINQITPET